MGNEKKNNNQFREDEIVIMSHVDKRTGEVVTRAYPKVAGRLRIAHEENGSLNISTEIIRYEENVAVVKALATTKKGYFNGLGMASLERDQRIAPAILELAETRAIARSLRFAGYGVEYCSAEEVSHLENGGQIERVVEDLNAESPEETPEGNQSAAVNRSNQGKKNDEKPGYSGARITNRQLQYALSLGKKIGWTQKELNEEALKVFGVQLDFLDVKEASSFIDVLKQQAS